MMVAEVEVWFVAEPDAGFVPNVNVLTQAIPAMELEEYLDLSVAQGTGPDAGLRTCQC